MCQSCGCAVTPADAHPGAAMDSPRTEVIEVLQNLLAANDRVAEHNREHFDEHGLLAINLMSSHRRD